MAQFPQFPQFPPVAPPVAFVMPIQGEKIVCDNTNYYIGACIGKGAFGTVYECTDDWGNRLVAKVLAPINKPYWMVRDEWSKELTNLQILRHPNITYIHKAFEYRNVFYIVMEKCELTLEQFMNSPDFNGEHWLPFIARDLLHALDFIHNQNYVHKDLHTGNIFVSNQFDPIFRDKEPVWSFKVGDLGITNFVGFIRPNTILAQWMLAPEVINQQFGNVGKQMDIYHVGLLLLRMVTKVHYNFSHQDIVNGVPRQIAENLDSPYSSAIANSLRRNVVYRTQSAISMWREIQNLVPKNYS